MIEAELKARLTDPAETRRLLGQRASAEHAVYRDTYFDDTTRSLTASGRELRVRTKQINENVTHILTYKDATVDPVSGSKPEHETRVDNEQEAASILRGLGYSPTIALTKHCANYTFTAEGRAVVATIATVPELDGTFLEVETLVREQEVTAALAALRRLLGQLGVTETDLTTELYTEAVAAQRGADTRPL